jgi:hypothetical protein
MKSGQLGLFLGASLLSCFEGMDVVIMFVHKLIMDELSRRTFKPTGKKVDPHN